VREQVARHAAREVDDHPREHRQHGAACELVGLAHIVERGGDIVESAERVEHREDDRRGQHARRAGAQLDEGARQKVRGQHKRAAEGGRRPPKDEEIANNVAWHREEQEGGDARPQPPWTLVFSQCSTALAVCDVCSQRVAPAERPWVRMAGVEREQFQEPVLRKECASATRRERVEAGSY